jgi:hypothetical protein
VAPLLTGSVNLALSQQKAIAPREEQLAKQISLTKVRLEEPSTAPEGWIRESTTGQYRPRIAAIEGVL